jgi:hypothetical protein
MTDTKLHDEIVAIRARVNDGTLDLRDVGKLLDGKWDQDLPNRILVAALAAIGSVGAADLAKRLEAREAQCRRLAYPDHPPIFVEIAGDLAAAATFIREVPRVRG